MCNGVMTHTFGLLITTTTTQLTKKVLCRNELKTNEISLNYHRFKAITNTEKSTC